jgi:hypothetical protein
MLDSFILNEYNDLNNNPLRLLIISKYKERLKLKGLNYIILKVNP